MPITLAYDTRDAVPEALKDHVAERDGKFIFEAEPLSVVTETQGKLKKLRADLDAKSTKLGRFAKLDELGEELDVDELLSLRELKKQGKPLTPDEKAELERLHQKQLTKLNGDLKARDERLTAAETQLKHFKLTVPLQQIALKAGVLPDDVSLALLETQSRFRLNDAGKIVVLDADGDETDITPETFFSKLYKEQRPKFYAATGAAGSGSQNNTNGGRSGPKTITRVEFDALSQADRMQRSKDGYKVVD